MLWTCNLPICAATQSSPKLPFNLSVLVDPDGQWALADVQSKDFTPLSGQSFSGGYTKKAHWLKLQLQARPAAPDTMVLEVHPAYLDELRLYTQDADGQWRETRQGDRHPFTQRKIAYRGFAFRLTDLPADTDTVYLRLQTSSSSVFSARLWASEQAFAAKLSAEYALLGVYFGILLLLLIANTLIVLQVQDALFRYYLLYLASSTFFIFSTNGLWAEFVFPDSPAWGDYLTSFCAPLVFVSGGLFYQRMMLIRRDTTPWLFWLNSSFVILSALTLIAIPAGYFTQWLALLINVQILVLVFWLVRAWQLWSQRQAPIGLLLAHVFTLLGAGAASLSLSGILSGDFWLLTGFQIGLLGAMLALQQVVAQRIAQIYQGQSQATMRAEMAEKNNQHQQKLLTMLTHEVKTPLSIIRIALEAGPPSPRMRQHAITSVQDICNVVDHCAESLKLSHRLQIAWQTLDVAALLQQLLEQRPLARPIDYSLATGNTAVLSDPTCLQLIFSNLLSNADKYAVNGSTIHIRLLADAEQLHIVFENLAQPGCQPDPEQVFAPYYRAAGAQRVSGSGVGLFIVKSMVDRMQAKINYQLKAGNQVSFTLTLPRQPTSPPAELHS